MSVVGMAAVKLALLQREAEEIQQGTAVALDETVSHSVLISTGLELEDQQFVVQHYFEYWGLTRSFSDGNYKAIFQCSANMLRWLN
jgi:hypothetical protein